jgi:hypothetical protein
MKNYNIFANENSDLEIHVDARGRIADAFFYCLHTGEDRRPRGERGGGGERILVVS